MHLSYSQIAMYCRCGEQYRRRYIENEIIPPGIAMVQGKAVHAAAEANFRMKMEQGELLPEKEVEEIAAARFDQEVLAGVWLTPEEEKEKAKVIGEKKDSTVRLAALHARTQAVEYEPIAVEEAFRIDLGQVELVGVIDLIDKSQRVIDIKTGPRKRSEDEVDKNLQLTMYALQFYRQYGQWPEVRLDVLVDGKKPARQVLKGRRTEEDIKPLAARINAVLRGIQAGVFPPASDDSWCCNPRWCGYYFSCPYVRKGD